MSILLTIIFTFWSIVVAKNILFWVYLWQLKEYRRDRIRAHFELATSRKILFNKRSVFVFMFLIFSFVPIPFVRITISLIALLFYGFFASRAVEQLQKHSLKLPKLTLRSLAALTTAFTLYGIISIAIFIYARGWFLQWMYIGDLAVPIFVALALIIFWPVTLFLKARVLERAEKKRMQMKNLLVVGITGSYGKTSVKEFLYTILTRRFKVLKTEQNNNTEMGVAHTILDKLTDKHEIFIVEMGAYKVGEIARIAQIVHPQIGILCGINQQHISLFGNMKNIQAAKYELIEALPEKGLAIFNGDNEYVRALYRQSKKPKRLYITDALVEPAHQSIVVESLKHTGTGMEIKIRDGRIIETFSTSLLGSHNASNILGAITAARALGMGYDEIKRGVASLSAPKHTLKIKKGIKGSILIDDTYSANVDGTLAALKVLGRISGRKKICIIQPLIELGKTAESAHKNIGARLADVCDFVIVTSSDYFPLIFREALDGGMSKDSVLLMQEPHEALRKAQEITDKDDVILLENRVPQELINGLAIRRSD